MNVNNKRLIIMLAMGFVIGSLVMTFIFVGVYADRFIGTVCMPEDQFQRIYDVAAPFMKIDIKNFTFGNFTFGGW